jgi:tetratricopeptide (TPR) repeat protein
MSAAAEPTVYPDARPVLMTWAGVLALVVLLGIGWHVGLAGYVGVLRQDSPWTYLKAAERYSEQKNWVGAMDMLQEAAKRGPDSPVPYERMGIILYQQRGDWAGAIEQFRKALERGSDSLDVRGKTIWTLIHLKQYEDAVTFGQQCIDEGSGSPYFPRFVGEALFRAGEFKRAVPYLEKALDAFPADMLLMERLLASYKELGAESKAARLEKRMHEHEG